jgi:hypothetical protein
MKSLQVLNVCRGNYTGYSELQVLRSAAGFYIGTTYTDTENGWAEPGSRDSDYFVHKEQAMMALAKLEEFTQEDITDGIFNWEAWLTKEGLDPRGVGYRMDP